jgi:Arm DNA-binding domain
VGLPGQANGNWPWLGVDVTLARARELASQARAKLAEGSNPRAARRATEGATFGECADRVIPVLAQREARGAVEDDLAELCCPYPGVIRYKFGNFPRPR